MQGWSGFIVSRCVRFGQSECARRRAPMERLMTIDEVAEHLRVPVLTVRWLRQDGRFTPAIKVGRRLVWEESAIIRWADENRKRMA